MPKVGFKHTAKTKAKMRIAKLGVKRSPEAIKRTSQAHIGLKRSEETKQKMRLSQRALGKRRKGSNHPGWKGGRFRVAGRHKCPECAGYKANVYAKICNECYREKNRGHNHPSWKGGITPENIQIRTSEQYKNWRRDVFVRDHFTCQHCGHRFIKIVAHHIKSFNEYENLRFELNNGVTLCKNCHKKTHFGL